MNHLQDRPHAAPWWVCTSPLTCIHTITPMPDEVASLLHAIHAAIVDEQGRTPREVRALERARSEQPLRASTWRVRERLSRLSGDKRARAMNRAVATADAAVVALRASWDQLEAVNA